ncbi:hypothetical protein HMPREF9104_01213 [Lentilactobacillus kisonensis F0435]|uniref:Uncharacterized protein n=1 Tax=Lentilactobacillus kisonensis F0435 TaxID=797516 RepID=H1LF37_9LACO|nr:hypothetical protein HMPREF9104_01213 [Lentilactobacillus kisonensis F0435]
MDKSPSIGIPGFGIFVDGAYLLVSAWRSYPNISLKQFQFNTILFRMAQIPTFITTDVKKTRYFNAEMNQQLLWLIAVGLL